MALSTPPPPPETTSDGTNTTAARPAMMNPFQRPPNPFYPRLPSNPNPNYPQLAPPRSQEQLFYPAPAFISRPLSRPSPRLPFLNPPYPDHSFSRPPQMQFGVPARLPISNSPQFKVGPPSALIPDSNGHKEIRDGCKDDSMVVVKDRKVRLKDNESLYGLCRSWLRNGFRDETQFLQPQYPDAVKSLPRPLALAVEVVGTADKKEGNKDKEDEDEEEGPSENLSSKELLQGLVRRAKRVRSRLREERLQRIDRYKTRLALLLPPVADQHLKNETN